MMAMQVIEFHIPNPGDMQSNLHHTFEAYMRQDGRWQIPLTRQTDVRGCLFLQVEFSAADFHEQSWQKL